MPFKGGGVVRAEVTSPFLLKQLPTETTYKLQHNTLKCCICTKNILNWTLLSGTLKLKKHTKEKLWFVTFKNHTEKN